MQAGGQPQLHHLPQPKGEPNKRRSWLYIGIVVAVAIVAGGLIWWGAYMAIQANVQVAEAPTSIIPTKQTATPQLTTETIVTGRDHVWEVAFLPTREMLFTERSGALSIFKDGKVAQLAKVSDVYVQGEGGLLGLAVDPSFTTNRYIYTCFNSSQGAKTIRVARWQVNATLTALTDRSDIITDIPMNQSGRHSGCRLAFGPDGYLWVGTGDTAQGDTAIQPKVLGGKILRVDRDGTAAPGNLGGSFDPRIYSYGHRNVQGLAFFPAAQQGVVGVNIEHGSDVDDEINLLKPGNFGWAPPPTGYDESVKMTDKTRFPDAIDAIWSSGDPTQAPSGATFLKGDQWKGWQGGLAVAFLKNQQLKVFSISKQNKVTREEGALKDQFGRMRTAVEGPDGNLYISTDNGGNDQIIRVTPH